MKYCRVSIVRNALGKYVVTKWTDYEYQKYLEQNFFSDRDLAADMHGNYLVGMKNIKNF